MTFKSGLLNGMKLGAITMATIYSLSYIENNLVSLASEPIQVQLDSGTIEVDKESFIEKRPFLCSAYAREQAKKIFGKEYSESAAWERVYEDKPVYILTERESTDPGILDNLVDSGYLIPGDLIGFKSDSSFSNGIDSRGNSRLNNHVALYLGEKEGEPVVAHQYGGTYRVDTQNGLESLGLAPTVVLDSRN